MTHKTITVSIEVSEETHENLLVVVANCNRSNKENEGFTSHGALDVRSLLTMLAEDAAMTNSRPGSWEGASMQHVLAAHGYH